MLSPLAITACSDPPPPTPSEVRSQITSDLGSVLHETNTAVANNRDTVPTASTLSLLDRLLGTDTSDQLSLTAMAPALARLTGGAVADDGTPVIDADAEVAYLNTNLFTDANHVGNGIYQLPASLVCGQTQVGSDGTSTTTVDPSCAMQLAMLDLRIRTAKDGGTLVFALQIDASHDEPLRLELTHTSIALTLDLDDLQHAETALSGLFGGTGSAAGTMSNVALGGELTGKLEILGTAKLKLSLSIDRALSIEAATGSGASLDGPDALLVASAAATGASLTLDGNAKSGTFAASFGKTTLRLPSINGKQLEVDLPGVSATATFADGQPLQLTHLGLGGSSTTVSVNGARGETIDLNPSDGRAVDLAISHDATANTTTVTVSPRLDLQLAIDHSVLGDAATVYDVTRVQLDGGLQSRDASGQISVTGALHITTNPASYGVSATAGQCVTSSATTDPTSGQPLTQWAVAACQ
ncbi:MAG TPA: hypothetical protein VH165_04300 [Kofleriaceae bacterium]|nr:hypothetical protein [Kofleriaceae bacterium]